MILVTIGNHVQPFDRLLAGMDELAARLSEEVVMQVGQTTYLPRYCRYFQFASGQHMKELTQGARVQVSHAGSGSILTALRAGVPLVVAPRLKRYNEHLDDHQLQIAGALEAQGVLVVVHDITPDNLEQAIQKACGLTGQVHSGEVSARKLVDWLRKYMEQYAAHSGLGQGL
jgi:UDP-N-acetylglucosamine transferase subunit ALG13